MPRKAKSHTGEGSQEERKEAQMDRDIENAEVTGTETLYQAHTTY